MSINHYQQIGKINSEHRIFLVKDLDTGEYLVQKILSVYNKGVYEVLYKSKIPHTPLIKEIVMDGDCLVVYEQFINGKNLFEMIDSGYKFQRDEIINYCTQLTRILSQLHALRNPIIHRDIKPSNIIISNGEVYLIDFNAGKFYDKSFEKNSDTTLLGTHGYAAPEQYGFGESTPKTDVYGVGKILEELLKNSATGIYKEDLEAISKRCCELNPDDRYESADDINKDLLKAVKRKRHISKYALPGFRSDSMLHAAIAVPVYVFIIFIAAIIRTNEGTVAMHYLYKLIFGLMMFINVFCICNYLDIHRFFPLCRSRNILLKIIGIIIMICALDTVLLIALVFFAQFLE